MTYNVRFYTFAIPISALAGLGYASSFKIFDKLPPFQLFNYKVPQLNYPIMTVDENKYVDIDNIS